MRRLALPVVRVDKFSFTALLRSATTSFQPFCHAVVFMLLSSLFSLYRLFVVAGSVHKRLVFVVAVVAILPSEHVNCVCLR